MLFAQTREDPNVELNVINKLCDKNKLKISCITSGGDTILSLLSSSKCIDKLDCVDININQNYLTKLKLAACIYLKDKLDVIKFLQGEFKIEQCNYIFTQLNLDYDTKKYWSKYMNIIHKGINREGKFEELFRKLVSSNFNYEEVFNRDYLIKIFGYEAVQNSSGEFSYHFRNVIERYKKSYKITENYFYHQIFYDRYDINCVPPYLNNIPNIRKNSNKLNFIHNNYIIHISNTSDNYYDIIQTSNLTDWMNLEALDNFIKDIHRCLKLNGYVIMRRLNGDYNLFEYLQKYFKCENVVDRSHFYTEVIIGQKIN